MKPTFTLYELEELTLHLKGELLPEELAVNDVDELVHVSKPARYDLSVQKLGDAILAQGSVHVELACECARCLRPFALDVDWPDWTAHLPLKGEDSIKVEDGAVDLTPILREDTLLRFPQHPLCKPECGGLTRLEAGKSSKKTGGSPELGSVWSALNQLKLK
jgi:uncharacterized metal-binding protein YceD (DUF177 family)